MATHHTEISRPAPERLLFGALSDVVQPRERPPTEYLRQLRADRRIVIGDLAESLLLADEVAIVVSGINLELPVLVEAAGARSLAELLDRGAIRFAWCPGMIGYITEANRRALDMSAEPGLHRLLPREDASYDPRASALAALEQQTSLGRDNRELLATLTEQRTTELPVSEVYRQAFEATSQDAASELGTRLGFRPGRVREDLEERQDLRSEMVRLAHHNRDILVMLAMNCWDLISEDLALEVIRERFKVQPQYRDDARVLSEVLTFEAIPSIATMVGDGRLTFEDVLEIRDSEELREFRAWLSELPPDATGREVVDAYERRVAEVSAGEIVRSRLRRGLISVAGTAVGAATGGMAGAVVGTIASETLQTLLDASNQAARKAVEVGWNPRVLIDNQLRPRATRTG